MEKLPIKLFHGILFQVKLERQRMVCLKILFQANGMRIII